MARRHGRRGPVGGGRGGYKPYQPVGSRCPEGEASLWGVCYPLGGNGWDLDGDGDPSTGQQYPGLYLNNMGLTGPMDPNIGLFNVSRMEMANNEITSMEGLPPNLNFINFSFNQITSIPESICPMIEAGLTFHLTHNQICESTVPSCIAIDDPHIDHQFPNGITDDDGGGHTCNYFGTWDYSSWCCCMIQDGSCASGKCCYDNSYCSGWYGVCDFDQGASDHGGCCVHTLSDGGGNQPVCSKGGPNWPECMKRRLPVTRQKGGIARTRKKKWIRGGRGKDGNFAG